jgi:hypothetical protein
LDILAIRERKRGGLVPGNLSARGDEAPLRLGARRQLAQPTLENSITYGFTRALESPRIIFPNKKMWRRRGQSFGDRGMMSLPFLLFACGLAAGWTQRRGAAMGFWAAGVVVMLVLFKMQATDALNISL